LTAESRGLTNYSPIRQMQLSRFTGDSWELFGDLLTG
jgi:hypothetical protein